MATEAVLEVTVYMHKFHNLDLFQQGWYQIKATSRWEGSTNAPGIPSRVVQYEVPDAQPDESAAIWQINDTDHSFSTHPFRVKYARQDVLLAVMISFNLSVQNIQNLLSNGVLICFELLYTPLRLSVSLDTSPFEFSSCSKHEFRLSPISLLDLHAYCPLHFDAWHMVLVDLTVHSILLKVNSVALPFEHETSGLKPIESGIAKPEASSEEVKSGSGMVDGKDVALWRALCSSRDLLKAKLEKISLAIERNADIEMMEHSIVCSVAKILDLTLSGKHVENGDMKTLHKSHTWSHGVAQALKMEKQSFGVSKVELLEAFHALGNELSSLWNSFLKFHRSNRSLIWEYLKSVWARERATECAAWMVHSPLNIEANGAQPSKAMAKASEEVGVQKTECFLGFLSLSLSLSLYIYIERENVKSKSVQIIRPKLLQPSRSSATRAELHRKSLDQMKFNGHSLQDMQIFSCPSQLPVILIQRHTIPCDNSQSSPDDLTQLEQASIPKVPVAKKTKGHGKILRAAIFVHGFQGHHLDLRLVRNQWLLIDPGAQCLLSEINEDRTMGDIKEQGHRLAEEVAAFLSTKLTAYFKNSTQVNCRLNFVGHSIGNLIIRSALTDPCLKPFLQYLHTFLSISGPHLGYLYSSNTLFNSGLWLLKKLKSSECMYQLTFTDQPDIQDCFLYKLSQEKTFEYFQHVLLASSPQDRYVPYHSARIEMCQAASRDSGRGPTYVRMVESCRGQILKPSQANERTFAHFDVNFNTSSQSRSLNNFIGRTAHIEFLETDSFLRFIMWTYPEFFS